MTLLFIYHFVWSTPSQSPFSFFIELYLNQHCSKPDLFTDIYLSPLMVKEFISKLYNQENRFFPPQPVNLISILLLNNQNKLDFFFPFELIQSLRFSWKWPSWVIKAGWLWVYHIWIDRRLNLARCCTVYLIALDALKSKPWLIWNGLSMPDQCVHLNRTHAGCLIHNSW